MRSGLLLRPSSASRIAVTVFPELLGPQCCFSALVSFRVVTFFALGLLLVLEASILKGNRTLLSLPDTEPPAKASLKERKKSLSSCHCLEL